MNEKIRNEFPYPIAKVYLRAINADEPIEKFTMTGYLFEITLKYAAAISICEYLNLKIRDITVNKILSGITKPSLGKWAEFLRETLKFNSSQKETIISSAYLKKSSDYKKMIDTVNNINRRFNPNNPSILNSVSPENFTNAFIQFRNKTKGHGAIQKADCIEINDILFNGVEEFILSFKEFISFPPVYISKVELDKDGKYNYSLQKLSGTDIIRTSYNSAEIDKTIRVNDICITNLTEDGPKPVLSLHPLFIFIEDREGVFVLNEGESSKIEYLCYHKGGKDAIYSPDELKEDFSKKFGEIIHGIKEKSTKTPEPEEKIETPGLKKKNRALTVMGIVLSLLILIVISYIFIFKDNSENKSLTLKSDSIIINKDTSVNKPAEKIQIPDNTVKDEQIKSKTSGIEKTASMEEKDKVEDKYYDDPDTAPSALGKAEDFLDYTNLKMTSNFRGIVKIKAYIGADGKVNKTETIGGGIDHRFNIAAENAVRNLSFKPALKNQKNVKSITIINVSFQGK